MASLLQGYYCFSEGINMNIINVIWIDDQYETLDSFMDECSLHDVKITPFSNPEDGLTHYRKHHIEVDALILDAKMFGDSEVNDLAGLRTCLNQILRLEGEFRKSIPYVVYTGQADFADDESFKGLVGEGVFFKDDEENGPMFARLRSLVMGTPEATLKQRYSVLYQSCFGGPMQTEVWIKLVPLLTRLENNEVLPDTAFNEVRQLLEGIFQSIVEFGLMPTEMGSNMRLNEVSKFLAGDTRPTGMALSKPLPKSVTKQLRLILEAVQTGSHHEDSKDGALRFRISELTKYVGAESRLANTLVLMTADLASWFAGLLTDEAQPYKLVHYQGRDDITEEGEVSYHFKREEWSLNTGRERKFWVIPDALASDLTKGNRYWCVVTTQQAGRGRKVSAIHSFEQTSGSA